MSIGTNMNPTLNEQEFIILKNFIPVERALALAEEFESYCKENNIGTPWEGLNASEVRQWPPFVELLNEKVGILSELTEVTLLPSFAQARVYHEGAALFHHKDRSACQFGITVHLRGDTDWPLFFQRDQDEEPTGVLLSPGEAILYLGSRVTHWRDFYVGNTYTQVFLFYVDANGPHANEAYDQLHNPTK
jgi:hypothetical protein